MEAFVWSVLPEKRRVWYKGLLPGLCLVLMLAGCRPGSPSGPLDTATAGAIVIAADESFKPLVKAEIEVFTGLYRHAEIQALYKPEEDAVNDVLEGRVRLAVVSRPLTEAEQRVFAQQKIIPRTLKIAEDGVALLLHPSNPDSLLTMQALRDIFSGRVTRWADLNSHNGAGAITIVFDSNRSSNLNFMLHTFDVRDLEHLHVYAADSNREVIDYVQGHENAIGVIGAGWISDTDDPAQQRFLASVTVAAIADVSHPAAEDYYQPYQAYLALERYPLRRDVVIISREARAGLGTGLMSHIASDRGQRIVLKSGLLPATLPVRLVGIKHTS